ncbi:unnamed protein product [Victoria cruziana]
MHGRRSLREDLYPYKPELNRHCRRVKQSTQADQQLNQSEESSREAIFLEQSSKILFIENMVDDQPPHLPPVDPPLLREYFIPSEYDQHTAAMGPDIGASQYEIKGSVTNILPTFHGIENEDPYRHIDEFLDVCATIRVHGVDDDVLRLRVFPFSLKKKAKYWLKSLSSSVRIRSWDELQCEFLKKYFSIGKSNQYRRAITSFTSHEAESFHQSWERMKELLHRC